MLQSRLKIQRSYMFILLLMLTVAGIAMLVYPVPLAKDVVSYSNGFYGDQFNGVVGYAPPGDFASVHLTSGNGIIVTIQVALNGAYTPIYNEALPAGTVDVPATNVGSGGTVFLTISSNNRVFTPMNIQARIFEEVTTHPYIPLGIGAVGVAGMIAIITRLGQVPFPLTQGKTSRILETLFQMMGQVTLTQTK